MKDWYSILGVSKDASQDDIKKAYRDLAKKWHPDRFQKKSEAERTEAEEKFKDISAAYDVLGDKDKRAEYDNPMSGSNGGFNMGGNGFPGFDFSNFSFHFGGDGFGGFGSNSGEDITLRYDITLEDIYDGIESKEFTFRRKVRCKDCKGSGKSNWKECPHCHGKGKFVETRRTWNGTSTTTRICPHCNGTGGTGTGTCHSCNGTGFDSELHTINVDFKRDWLVQDNVTINVNNEGSEAKTSGLPNGDVHINLRHNYDKSRYMIKGYDLYEHVDINVIDALLGCKKEVILPNGKKILVTVPECTQHNKMLCVQGQGIKMSQTLRGNYYLCVNIVMPNSLTDKERDILKKLK